LVTRRRHIHVRLAKLRQLLKVVIERAIFLHHDHEVIDRNALPERLAWGQRSLG
jgi:hypothetical protein